MKSKKGYWIGGTLITVGVVGAILWFVLGFVGISNQVDDFQRVQVPGSGSVQLPAETQVLYVEGDDASVEAAIDGLALEGYDAEVTYAFGDREGTAFATVTAPRAGEYELTTTGQATAVAVGDSIAGPLVRTIVGAIAIGALLTFAGVILIVVTAIRHRRNPAT